MVESLNRSVLLPGVNPLVFVVPFHIVAAGFHMARGGNPLVFVFRSNLIYLLRVNLLFNIFQLLNLDFVIVLNHVIIAIFLLLNESSLLPLHR